MMNLSEAEIWQCEETASTKESSREISINLCLAVKLFDIYIGQRIRQDKVIEGILHDIQACVQQMPTKSPLSKNIVS
jgi:hypothetical protein